MNILENQNIILRAPEPEDIDILYKWENNNELWNVSDTLVPFSKYLLTKYIENSHFDIYQTRELKLIIDLKSEKGNIPAGLIDVFDFEPYHNRAGIGIMIHDIENRRKHIAFEALTIFINYAFSILKLKQLYCNITEDNTASIQLFEKLGFTAVGLKKDWLKTSRGWKNEWMYQLISST